ncbi:hypothetical protein, partial [Propionibacterium freudenreichii]
GQESECGNHILPGGLRYLTRSQPPGEVHLAGTCSGNIRLVVNGDPGEASWDRLYEGNRDLFKRLVGSDQYSSLKMIIGANWYALVPAAQASDLAAATGAQTYK